MQKSPRGRLVAVGLFALVGFVGVHLLSTYPYEWMIGESAPGEPPLTYCTLPAPPDSSRDVGLIFAGVLASFSLAMGALWRREAGGRAFLVASALLGLLAIYRFFLCSLLC